MGTTLSYREALAIVLKHAVPLLPQRVQLSEALGLAAAEDIQASENVPPFTNSAMDGFALRSGNCMPASEQAPVRLRILGDLAAGQVANVAVEDGTALRIMTGAPLPEGADAVVPVEHAQESGGWLEIRSSVRPHADIRFAGEDIREGTCVVTAGTTLNPGEIGVLAAIGCGEVPVHPKVRVAVLTTGDELVDVSTKPGPGQIRDANIHAVCAQLRAMGAMPIPFARVPDTREAVEHALQDASASADLILRTGGISVGDYDFVKTMLDEVEAKRIFWRVAQKPGGPLGFWLLQGKPFFGIPGNPVAAMVMVEEYVRPMLRRMMGYRCLFRPEVHGILEQAWSKSKPDGKVHILRVIAKEEGGMFYASLTGPQGSGILSSMMRANALALVPEDTTEIPAGGRVLLHLSQEAEDH